MPERPGLSGEWGLISAGLGQLVASMSTSLGQIEALMRD